MKKKSYLLFTLILGTILLVGCSSKTGNEEQIPNEEDSSCIVTFYQAQGGAGSSYTKEVESGTSLEDVLTNNDVQELKELTSKDDTLIFEGWYTSLSGANSLVEELYFDFSTEISADLYLYAGYTDTTINTRVSDFVQIYLGVYEEFDLDPFPLLDAQDYALINDLGSSFQYLNVTSHTLQKYYDSLVNYYGFTKISDDTYLSKEEIYLVTYTYDTTYETLRVDISFNDTLGKFPTYYFASNFYGIDFSYYINETNFGFADEANTSDEDRYMTYCRDNNGVDTKYIFFTPSSNYYEPLSEVEEFFEDCGFTESSTYGYWYDDYQSAYVYLDFVTDEEVILFSRYGLDINTSMIKIEIMPNEDRTSLDEDYLELYLSYLCESDWNEAFDYHIEADAYSELYLAYSSSYYYYYAPMYYALGVDVSSLEAYIDSLTNSGWKSSVSGTSYTSVTLSSPTSKWEISLLYYPNDTYVDINTSILRITFIRYTNAFDYLNLNMSYQSNGGKTGIVTEIPEFEAYGYSRGTTSSTTTLGYYIIGYGTTLEVYTNWIEEISSQTSSWLVDSISTYDASFTSTCGFYTLTAYYRGGIIRVDLTYNATKDVDSISEASNLAQNRLGYNMNQNVLTILDDYNSLTVLQYFDGSYNRAIVYYNYSTEAEASDAYDRLVDAIEENLTFLSSGSVDFYQDNNGLIYYAYYEEYTNGYRVGFVAYNPN